MAALRQYRFLVVGVCAVILGCDEPFTPKGEFREEIVAYSIVSNLSDTHFARLYRTYNPPGYDPFEQTSDNSISGALIQITDGFNQWVYRDTVIARADSSRYTSPIGAYVISSFQPTRGMQYSLQIQPPGGQTMTATLRFPEQGFISFYRNSGGVSQPRSVADRYMGVRATIPTITKGYMIRFHVTFDALENSVWVPHEIEIPYFINNVGLPEEQYEYYGLTRSFDGSGTPGTVVTHIADFNLDSYLIVIGRLYSQYGSGGVRFKKGILTLTQVEQQLYSYYNISRGFRDPNSIRVDEPDYSNIRGGAGVFGGFSVDSLIVSLPTTL